MTESAQAEWLLGEGLEQLGITTSGQVRAALMAFGGLVLRANEKTNLVGRRTLDELVVKDILDSLAPFALLEPRSPLIDLGSGAGFPGVPIAIAFSKIRVALLEPRAKRAAFLVEAITKLALTNVECVRKTAGAAAESPLRQSAAFVTARAFGPAEAALEAAAPLVASGGSLLLYRGKDADPSRQLLEMAGRKGLRLRKASEVAVPYLDGARHAWWFEKAKLQPRSRKVRH